ncbi:VapC toxin family PIN domain ribonuclease [Achromobacter aloeverae]
MVLVDTSVWIQHFKQGNLGLVNLLARDAVLAHPMVIGEIACGTPPDRQRTLGNLELLQPVRPATLQETMAFIERENLYGLGCGLVDLLLLVSVLVTPGAVFWTYDRRLGLLAERFDVAYVPRLN